ncbi:type VII secretion-associated serine protease mycosin [Glycomyces albus]
MALLPSAPSAAIDPLGWHLHEVDAATAWDTADGTGVTVAVVDSGVDADHPNLLGAVLPGRSYVDSGSDSEPRLLALGGDVGHVDYERAFAHADPVGHGTAVAGIIAGRPESGLPGVAPGAEILPVRVLDDENRYHDSSMVAAAVEWAVDSGADVVNLSLGGHYESPAFREAVDYAAAHDVVVVACTGNQAEADDGERVWFPASDDRVLAVTGTDRTGRRWPTAITGEATDLAAPGAELTAPEPGGGYRAVTGTSFATAVVSGTAALVRSAHPDLTAPEVRQLLTATADRPGPGLGAGIVDAAAAVETDPDLLPPPPVEMRAAAETSGAWPVAAFTTGAGMLCVSLLLLRSRRNRADSAGAAAPRNMAG